MYFYIQMAFKPSFNTITILNILREPYSHQTGVVNAQEYIILLFYTHYWVYNKGKGCLFFFNLIGYGVGNWTQTVKLMRLVRCRFYPPALEEWWIKSPNFKKFTNHIITLFYSHNTNHHLLSLLYSFQYSSINEILSLANPIEEKT